MFKIILSRFLLILPFLGLTTSVALGMEMSTKVRSEQVVSQSSENSKENLSWIVENFEELEEGDDKHDSFLGSGTELLSIFEYKPEQSAVLTSVIKFAHFSFLRFPSLYIANCVFRL